MPTLPELHVQLNDPPERRWALTDPQAAQAHDLIRLYQADFGGPTATRALATQALLLVPPAHLRELQALAARLGVPVEDAVFANVYYDVVKAALGYTAFAVPTPDGPLYARNLDWWTEHGALARHTTLTRYFHGDRLHFTSVGWPGFTGVLSGVAPGRFAITLNAVLSDEPPRAGLPVTLFLRDVLEHATTFREAVHLCRTTPLLADCLLLITGVNNDERLVIECTPTRHATRTAPTGPLVVANDYQQLHAAPPASPDALHASSGGRYACALALAREHHPQEADACLRILTNPGVRMGITVQHMVLNARSGAVTVRPPT
ncbi:C45 family autoproteolytic acyltransferase/hydolase [Deinococcus maricopensis]|uniref:Peptidase C45 acyl-coenzyme A:6-aminopenicillanic acid acyl-transferase n=1 Tax=Deinococcus maricopensis (strain DSM 21211 / LMG 22137 / NRRL B-23946 / LB-34) TaxID=709986 RepID=E8UBT7_DEIML|nr:C45 family peptidase [Deinococcus maricopensis]ADV68526.1 peptidase C45 acyl-coenzyme A:6-aminopenicillanic acid acyl-transferase [Deinococcus maricopensis DSM 21211]